MYRGLLSQTQCGCDWQCWPGHPNMEPFCHKVHAQPFVIKDCRRAYTWSDATRAKSIMEWMPWHMWSDLLDITPICMWYLSKHGVMQQQTRNETVVHVHVCIQVGSHNPCVHLYVYMCMHIRTTYNYIYVLWSVLVFYLHYSKPIASLLGQGSPVFCVRVDSPTDRIFSVGNDNTVKVNTIIFYTY